MIQMSLAFIQTFGLKFYSTTEYIGDISGKSRLKTEVDHLYQTRNSQENVPDSQYICREKF